MIEFLFITAIIVIPSISIYRMYKKEQYKDAFWVVLSILLLIVIYLLQQEYHFIPASDDCASFDTRGCTE